MTQPFDKEPLKISSSLTLFLSPPCRAVKNMESFQEEMSSYQSLTTHITSQSLDRLFTNLARPDFTPDLVEGTS
jgi:hypothetical protein